MTVGVRELKSNLSRYLRRVQAGEHLTVTDRGLAIATISPADRRPNLDWVHRMVARGEATWGGGKVTVWKKGLPSRGKPASVMVLEDRK